jgi:Mg/Co/Ni transporter MgtE
MSRFDDMPPEKREELRRMIDADLDVIETLDADTLELIERRWPWLLANVKPKKLS